MPIGAETLRGNGYLVRKVNDDLPYMRRWRYVHHLIWEEVNGPVPEGWRLVFRDGDKTNVVLDNLELVRGKELLRRNGIARYGPEIHAITRLHGLINRKINQRREENA